jgi:hypothetical protein
VRSGSRGQRGSFQRTRTCANLSTIIALSRLTGLIANSRRTDGGLLRKFRLRLKYETFRRCWILASLSSCPRTTTMSVQMTTRLLTTIHDSVLDPAINPPSLGVQNCARSLDRDQQAIIRQPRKMVRKCFRLELPGAIYPQAIYVSWGEYPASSGKRKNR